jgi:hypothetical protein
MKAALLSLVASLAVLAVGPALLADPPGPGSAAPADAAGARDRVLKRLRERGLVLPSGSTVPPLPSVLAAPSSSSAVPAGSGAAPVPSAGPLHEHLARQWQKLAESRHERRERHRAALVRELGQRLSDPHIKAELKLHATRVAELSRLKFLADNARTGAQRDKLLSRIDTLSNRETQRHRARMAKLLGARPLPSGSGAPLPAPAPSAGPKP